jgi:pyruvate/2-oxoacid:ferredoxin oxidoreductase alpha subunit
MCARDKVRMKLMDKMEKYREKIVENEMKLARVERMLAVADILFAQGASAQVPESAVDATDMGIAEDIAKLRMMSPEGLKVKRL